MKRRNTSSSRRDYTIQVLQRAMQVLDVLLDAQRPLGLEELSIRSGIATSTTFRIVTNLLQHGYLTETSEGYWLGLRLLSLGAAVEEHLDLRHLASPILKQLRNQVNETVHLAILNEGGQVFYLDKLLQEQAVGVMRSQVGMTLPIHCTGLGKMLAAFQPEWRVLQWVEMRGLNKYTENTITNVKAFLQELDIVRQRGYAIDNREHEDSIRCIAAPICNYRGDVIAAISVAGPHHRMPEPLVDSTVAKLTVAAAQEISKSFGAEG